MLQFFAVLSMAVAAVSASLVKEELNQQLIMCVDEVKLAAVISKMAIDITVDKNSAMFPSSAECMMKITQRPSRRFVKAMANYYSDVAARATLLAQQLSYISRDDEKAIERMAKKIHAFSAKYSSGTVYYALEATLRKLHGLAKTKCNCQKYGWCSVFAS